MKRLFLSAIMYVACFFVQAQEWKVIEQKADELKGIKAYISYSYEDETSGFVFWSTNDDQFRIANKSKMFNYERASGYYGCQVVIGLYSNTDELIEKIKMWLDTKPGEGHYLHTRNAGTMSNPVGQSKKARKILNHLSTSNGYIRILAPQYGQGDCDIKIPCMPDSIKSVK